MTAGNLTFPAYSVPAQKIWHMSKICRPTKLPHSDGCSHGGRQGFRNTVTSTRSWQYRPRSWEGVTGNIELAGGSMFEHVTGGWEAGEARVGEADWDPTMGLPLGQYQYSSSVHEGTR